MYDTLCIALMCDPPIRFLLKVQGLSREKVPLTLLRCKILYKVVDTVKDDAINVAYFADFHHQQIVEIIN